MIINKNENGLPVENDVENDVSHLSYTVKSIILYLQLYPIISNNFYIC